MKSLFSKVAVLEVDPGTLVLCDQLEAGRLADDLDRVLPALARGGDTERTERLYNLAWQLRHLSRVEQV